MPRDRIDDPDTPGLYVQVNCRRANDAEGGGSPGHLQISTHDERADARVVELLGEASALLHSGGDDTTAEEGELRRWLIAEWTWKLDNFRAELTGTYVTLTPDTSLQLVKLTHRGRNLAYPPGSPRVPGALDGVRIPRAGETSPQSLNPPGATGYRLPPTAGQA